jgi:DNA polymerase-1
MADKQHLYLVDGSAYIFRAYHRLPPLTNPHGVPVGAVYGYTTMLWKLADDLHKADGPTHLAVILDKGAISFRNQLYDQYKANRPPPPEDLVPQFPLIRDATRAFSLPCIEEDNLEADDLIASYAREATRRGWDVTIVSSDKDLMQLVGQCAEADDGIEGGCIDMLDTMKNLRIDIPEVIEKFGVPPELVGDVLALMGDAVDNVPGIYGIGPKTASKLIQDYGSLTGALDAAEGMKPGKLRDRLIEGREMALLSRVLVQLKEDCPLPMALDDFKLEQVPKEPLADVPHRARLHQPAQAARRRQGQPRPADPAEPGEAGHGRRRASTAGNRQPPPEWPAVDRATYEDRPVARTARALDAPRLRRARGGGRHRDQRPRRDARRADRDQPGARAQRCLLRPARAWRQRHVRREAGAGRQGRRALGAEAAARERRGAQGRAEHQVRHHTVARNGIAVVPVDDTMIISFDLDAGRSEDGIGGGHGMDELSTRHLGHTTLTYKDICGSGKKSIPFGEVPLDRATEYAAEDADVTWRLHKVLKPRLAEEHGTRVYERVDRPLIPVVAQMERHGIKVDRQALAGLSEEFAKETARIEREIWDCCGVEFTIGSPAQLGEVLFNKLGYKGGRKGKSGQYSTDQAILEGLASQGAPVAETGARMAPADQAAEHVHRGAAGGDQPGHRPRAHLLLAGRRADRAAVVDRSQPAEHPDPHRDRAAHPRGVRARGGHDAAVGRLLADRASACSAHGRRSATEGSIHCRRGHPRAHRAGDVRRGRPRHPRAGQDGQLRNPLRHQPLGPWRPAGIEADEAQAIIDRYFERFPGIQRYIVTPSRACASAAIRRRCSAARPGSRGSTPRSRTNARAASARRSTRRSRATSADIIKRAMARMPAALADAGLGQVKMLLQVHDELVFELPEGDVAAASPVIERVMAEAALPAVRLEVPLGIEIGHGPSWDAAH